MLHTSVSRTSRSILERVVAAVEITLRILYPPAARPRTTAVRDAQIRARIEAGERQIALAREYGISYQRVSQIVNGKQT